MHVTSSNHIKPSFTNKCDFAKWKGSRRDLKGQGQDSAPQDCIRVEI